MAKTPAANARRTTRQRAASSKKSGVQAPAKSDINAGPQTQESKGDSDVTVGQEPTAKSSSLSDGLLNLDAFTLFAEQLVAYGTLEKLLRPVYISEFGALLEERVRQFQRCKHRIKRAINKDFDKQLGTPQRAKKPLATLQERIREYKKVDTASSSGAGLSRHTRGKKSMRPPPPGVVLANEKRRETRLATGKKSIITVIGDDELAEEVDSDDDDEFDTTEGENGEESESSAGATSGDNNRDEEGENDDDDEIDEDVRTEAIRRATACPRLLKQSSLSKSATKQPRSVASQSGRKSICAKMQDLQISDDDDNEEEESNADEHEEEDDEEEEEDASSQASGSSSDEADGSEVEGSVDESPHNIVRKATPYPKRGPPSTASSYKGTPHPGKKAASMRSTHSSPKKPADVKSVRSVGGKAARPACAGAQDDQGSPENYDLGDLSSGDATDNEEQPRKPVPSWAQLSFAGPIVAVLRNVLNEEQRQRHFGQITLPTLDVMFRAQLKNRKNKKTPRQTEARLAWVSPLHDPRAADSRYLQMREEVNRRNAGLSSVKKGKK